MSDSITSLTNAVSSNSGDQTVGIAVLKKALDSETATAAALLDALPPVQRSGNLPPNLGRNINTTAGRTLLRLCEGAFGGLQREPALLWLSMDTCELISTDTFSELESTDAYQ